MNQLHGIVFAYRSNPALRELTFPRNTCSVPFGGRYRIVDFMLSSLANAGVAEIGLIVHASYQSLLDHVGSGKDWDLSRRYGGLRILPPFGYSDPHGTHSYEGRMVALASVRDYLHRIRQEYVVLAGGDLVINLPLEEVLADHCASGADITAVCSREHRGDPRHCLYLECGENGAVRGVSVSPAAPVGYESLEVYLLSTKLLLRLVDHCAAHGISSFGRGVLSALSSTLNIRPWLFSRYCARIQSVESYYRHSMELLDPAVRAQLFLAERGICTRDPACPSTYYGPKAEVSCSLLADGCRIEGTADHSILFRGVHIGAGAKVSHSILLEGTIVEPEARLHCAIADKNVRVRTGQLLMGHQSCPFAIAKNTIV